VCVWCVECLCFNFVTAQKYNGLETQSKALHEENEKNSNRMTEVCGVCGCVGVLCAYNLAFHTGRGGYADEDSRA
jgi:hypothetical protein